LGFGDGGVHLVNRLYVSARQLSRHYCVGKRPRRSLGATAALLATPGWKAVRQWPAPRQKLLLFGVLVSVATIGGLFWIRVRQVARLETLFQEIHEVGTKGAPQKQLFMKLSRQDTQSLPEYLQRCADLEPVLNDYMISEQQMDAVLARTQQAIADLKPKGSFGNMLPMLSVMRKIMEKDLEGANAYKQEIAFAKQLPNIPAADRVRFYNENIGPVVKQEHKVAQDEFEVLKEAKARGVEDMPENLYRDAGIKQALSGQYSAGRSDCA